MCRNSNRRAHPAFAGHGPPPNTHYGPQNAYGEPVGFPYGSPGHTVWGPGTRGRGCGRGRRQRGHGTLFGFVVGKIQEKQANRLDQQQYAYQVQGQMAPQQFVQRPYQAPEQYQFRDSHKTIEPYRDHESRAREDSIDEKQEGEDGAKSLKEENDKPPPRYSFAVGERI